jgi:2-keto-3-deoxy-L-rhamnonate aldolase RhmA
VNTIRQAVSEGRPSLGAWFASGSPVIAELAGRAGLDWVLLDTQHGAVTDADLLPCLLAAPTVEQLLELGVELITIGVDTGHVTQGVAANAARRRELIAKYRRGTP